MGALGPAIIFVCSMVGAVIVGVYTLAFSASALLIVVEGTAAGNDEVPWSKEPWSDIIHRAVYLACLLGLWMIPAGFLWNGLREVWLPDNRALRLLLIALPGLWLFFPLGLLSSLRSVSGWGFLRLDMLRDMARVLPATLMLYGVSALLAVLLGVLWYYTLRISGMLLFLTAPVTAFCWLIYARLLGRLALKIGCLRPTKKEKKIRQKQRDQDREELEKLGPVRPATATEAAQELEPVKQARPAWLDPEPDPYTLSDEPLPERPTEVPLDGYDPPEAEDLEPPEPGLDGFERSRREMAQRDRRLKRRKKAPKLPERPMIEGILTFPFYRQCIAPTINLAFGWGAFGMFLVLMAQFNPM